MTLWRSLWIVAVVAVVAIGGLRVAHAQPDAGAGSGAGSGADDATRAAKLYEDGKRHFDIGEYAPAIASWKESYLLSSAPLLLFNIGQAYRLANNCAQANRFYLNYKRVEPKPKNQAELDQAMTKCAGVEPATGDPTAPPTSPPDPVVAPPVATPEPTPPVTTPVAAPVATPPPVSTPVVQPSPPPRSSSLRTAGIVVGSVGVASLVVGGLFQLKAAGDANDVNTDEKNHTPYAGAAQASDKAGKAAATRAQVFGIGGVVLAGAGLTMFLIAHHDDEAAHVGVAIVPGHAEVSYTCAF